jgi:5-methylcytosine-specific restriction endonuclease McrA
VITMRYKDGQFCPTLDCEQCGLEISDGAPANYYWLGYADCSCGPIHYVHKACSWQWERVDNPPPPGALWMANDLACLPIYLMRNLGVNIVKGMQKCNIYSGYDSELRHERPDPEEWESLRQQVFERDNHTCQYCGKKPQRLQCDHIVPISRGGTNDLTNLVAACYTCNYSKRAKPVDAWLAERA